MTSIRRIATASVASNRAGGASLSSLSSLIRGFIFFHHLDVSENATQKMMINHDKPLATLNIALKNGRHDDKP
jgi:hypothetical protein